MVDKRRIASLYKRVPWIGVVALRVYRRWQPWVTIGAVGVVFNDDDQLLLVEHVYHPKSPWGLPGGWSKRDEDPGETVRREVFEETGLHVNVIKPLLIEHTPYLRNHLDAAYLCYAPAEEIRAGIRLCSELLDYTWIEPPEAASNTLFHARAIQAAAAEWRTFRQMAAVSQPIA